jgi:hypothetical protein
MPGLSVDKIIEICAIIRDNLAAEEKLLWVKLGKEDA